jgi:hypothetical protein
MMKARVGSVLMSPSPSNPVQSPIGSNETTIMKQLERQGPVRSKDHEVLQCSVIVAAVLTESSSSSPRSAASARPQFTERAPRTVPNLGCTAKFVSGRGRQSAGSSRLEKALSLFFFPPKFSTFYLSHYPQFNHLSSYSTFIKYGGRSSRTCQFSIISHAITSLIVVLTPQVIDNGSGMCKAGCK